MITNTWQDVQIKCGLSDEQLSKRVKDRIAKFNKKSAEVAEYKESLDTLESTLQNSEPGSRKYRDQQREITALTEAIADEQAELDDLNKKLCSDMERLKKNAPLYEEMAKRLKTPAQTSSSTPPDPDPAPEQVATASAATASIAFMLTQEMRQQLYALNYTEADVDKMKPEEAQQLITDKVAATIINDDTNLVNNPIIEKPTHSEQTSTTPPAGPEKPAGPEGTPGIKKVIPTPAKSTATPAKKDETEPGKKKSNNGIWVGLGVLASFVSGIFIGKKLK